MDLRECLYRKRKSQTEAAEELGITREYLNEIINQKEKPSRILADRIIEWSGKKITYSELWDWDK